jgi:hypothetical protein
MIISKTLALAVAAVSGAGFFATAVLSESTPSHSHGAAIQPLSHSVTAPLPAGEPAPRECRDARVDTNCSYN